MSKAGNPVHQKNLNLAIRRPSPSQTVLFIW